MTRFHSFILSFSRVLAWSCCNGERVLSRVLRTVGERTDSNVQAHFKNAFFMFAICLSGQSKSHGQAQCQCGRGSAHGQFEYITATIYHPGFAKPATLPVKAWKDREEGISSGMVLHIQLTWEQLDRLLVWPWYQTVPEGDMTHQGPHIPKLFPSHRHAQPLSHKEALVRDSILVAGEGWAME